MNKMETIKINYKKILALSGLLLLMVFMVLLTLIYDTYSMPVEEEESANTEITEDVETAEDGETLEYDDQVSGEVEESENAEEAPFGPEIEQEADSSIQYDSQPGTIEEVQAWIDAFEDALTQSGLNAALAAKPHWEYEVDSSLIPAGYRCELVDWDEDFGADYYTFFSTPAPISNHTVSNWAGIRTAITSGSGTERVITISGAITASGTDTAIEIPAGITVRLTATAARTITYSRQNYRHFIVYGTLIIENNITLSGGTVYNATSDSFTTIGGGGVHVMAGGEIKMTGNAAITSCYVTTTDTTSGRSGGGVFMAGGTLTMEDSSQIKNCYAMGGGGGGTDNAGYGGGVTSYGELNMYGSASVTGNMSNYQAGGVFLLNSGVLNMYDYSSITSNTCNESGGGVSSRGDINMYGNSQVSGNSVKTSGGGMFLSGSTGATKTFNMTDNAKIINNTAINGTLSDVPAADGGGGIYISTNVRFIMSGDAAVSGNTTDGSGGGVHSLSEVIMRENAVVENNLAYRNNAGGVLINTGSLEMLENATIRNNNSGIGGGVYIIGSAVFTMWDGKIVGNITTTGAVSAIGGGVYISSGSFMMRGGIIGSQDSPNTSDQGGGVFVNNGSFTMNDGLIDYNEASMSGGGVYLNARAVCQITDNAVISNNKAPNGGGIYAVMRNSLGGSMTISGGEVKNNTASLNGGGVYIERGTFAFTGGSVNNNTAEGDVLNGDGRGGGVYLTQPSAGESILNMSGSAVIESCAAKQGGGIYSNGVNIAMRGDSTIKDCHVSSEKGKGGGVYTLGELNMYDSAGITGNTAEISGGGAYTNNTLNMYDNSSITQNTCQNSGGGVFAHSDINMYGYSQISGNSSQVDGGGVSTYTPSSTITFNMTDNAKIMNNTAIVGTIDDNKIGDGGAGVFINENTTFNMNGNAEISGNTTDGPGGGVHTIGEFIMSEDAVIRDNLSTHLGGGVMLVSGSFEMLGNTSIRNNTGGSGGGVYLTGSSAGETLLNMSGGSIVQNTASGDGGGIYLAVLGAVQIGNAADACNITGNTAGGDGGGIYCARVGADYTNLTAYGNLTVGTNAMFNENTAARKYDPPSVDIISAYSLWATITNHNSSLSASNPGNRLWPMNNYDINVFTYTVRFLVYVDGNFTELIATIYVPEYSKIPPTPYSYDGSSLSGWLLSASAAMPDPGDALWDFDTEVTSDIDLYINLEGGLSGSITIIKVGDGMTLTGAKFMLEYYDTEISDWTSAGEDVTDEEGKLVFSDLPKGEYRITELESPNGYILLKESITVTIPFTLTLNAGEEAEAGYNNVVHSGDGATATYSYYNLTYTVNDLAVMELPESGNGGILPDELMMAGIAIIFLAYGALLLYLKRPGKGFAV